MEELSFVWLIAGFVTVLALRSIFSRLVRLSAEQDDYSREVRDILTKDEYKVKGRFE